MSGAVWIGKNLFLGRSIIGAVSLSKEPGQWIGLSYLPGAATVIGRDFPDEAAAKDRVMKSAQSRCKAMFGAGLQTTLDAVHEGRELRTTARAIWRAGVWRCDRPIDAHAMFTDLGRALGFKDIDAPRPASNDTPSDSGSSAAPPPDPVDMIERA